MDKSLSYPTPLVEVSKPFKDFGIDKDLLENIHSYGFKKACVVQAKTIPSMLQKRDVILHSQSNSGKKTASLISILQLIEKASTDLQALIIAPTRELAQAIHKSIQILTIDLDIRAEICVGGVNIVEQRKKFQETKFQIVVGTSGKIEDSIKRGLLKIDQVKVLALEECDELFGRGFEEQIKSIIEKLPINSQKMIITCTIPPEVLSLRDRYMKEPIELSFNNMAFFIEKIKQWYIGIPKEEWKLDTLDMIYTKLRVPQSIIYCNSSDQAHQIMERSKKWRYKVFTILDDLEESNKLSVFNSFYNHHNMSILITTDRSLIDINLNLKIYLINYSLPLNSEEYIAMVENIKPCNGDSVLLTLATPKEGNILNQIEKSSQHEIREMIIDAWDFPIRTSNSDSFFLLKSAVEK